MRYHDQHALDVHHALGQGALPMLDPHRTAPSVHEQAILVV